MKKILFCFLLVCANLLLAGGFKGIIEKIDDTNKTITLNGTVISVMPYTKIKQESCTKGRGTPKLFADLKQGDFVDVDSAYDKTTIIAKKIKVKCPNRAY